MSEIVLSCGRRCRVVLDTSREFRQYVSKCVPYIFGLDMVSGMTTYTSMIARFCAETVDWNEMVGDWVCGLGEDDCWIYLCPMMSLGCLPLATNEEPLPPYFERLVSGDLGWSCLWILMSMVMPMCLNTVCLDSVRTGMRELW